MKLTETVQMQLLAASTLCSNFAVIVFVISQGPKVSDEKLREMCSAIVEGAVCSP